jgi:hypothetical protein
LTSPDLSVYSDPTAKSHAIEAMTTFFTLVEAVLPASLTPASAAEFVWDMEANMSTIPVPPDFYSDDPMAMINNTQVWQVPVRRSSQCTACPCIEAERGCVRVCLQFITPSQFQQLTGIDLPTFIAAYAPNVTTVAATFVQYISQMMSTVSENLDAHKAFLMW